MTAKLDLVRAYLAAYAARDLTAVDAMFADAITLRDWNIRVVGKAAALEETRKNFDSVESLSIEVLAAYERDGGAAAELKIGINGRDTIYVVDVFDLDADGRITAIRAYIGRGDE
ncbi:nuclear transport factor 2 family protein [Roseateles sp. NT4]|uniref:nuclear transport factor 2 family protein n=1 Tax=Roseateles sp. NT4 TaxID=3453715 RepID=UPI003EEBFB1F